MDQDLFNSLLENLNNDVTKKTVEPREQEAKDKRRDRNRRYYLKRKAQHGGSTSPYIIPEKLRRSTPYDGGNNVSSNRPHDVHMEDSSNTMSNKTEETTYSHSSLQEAWRLVKNLAKQLQENDSTEKTWWAELSNALEKDLESIGQGTDLCLLFWKTMLRGGTPGNRWTWNRIVRAVTLLHSGCSTSVCQELVRRMDSEPRLKADHGMQMVQRNEPGILRLQLGTCSIISDTERFRLISNGFRR